MNTDIFKIDLFEFWNNYTISDHIKIEIRNFLINEGHSKTIIKFYEEFLERRREQHGDTSYLTDRLTHKQNWKENFKDGATQKEMARQMYDYPDIVDNPSGYSWVSRQNKYFFDGVENGFYGTPGVIINLPMKLDYKKTTHKPMFRKLFVEIFSQTQWPNEFLDYHLKESFDNDLKKYKDDLLTLIEIDHSELKRIKILHNWIVNSDDKSSSEVIKSVSKLININSSHIDEISKSLDGKFKNTSIDQIKSILKGDKVHTKLLYEGDAVSLVGIFWELNNCSVLNDTKEKIASWIVDSFEYTKKRKNQGFKIGTIIKHLSGQSNPSSKKLPIGISDIIRELKEKHS